MTAPLVLFLPMPPNLGNHRMHWRTRLKQKKQYWRTLDLVASREGMRVADYSIPRPPESPMTRVEVAVHMQVWNLMDDDNAMSRMKFVLDWLKNRGYIADDSRKHMRWKGMPTQDINRKSALIRLTLTPLTDEQPRQRPDASPKGDLSDPLPD